MDLDIAKEFNSKIQQIIDSQVNENREAIFFIYADLSTSNIYQGETTHISLSKEEEAKIMSQGEIIGSVHTHPSGFDPSTIDIMTGIATSQKYMSVATPLYDMDSDKDFVLTTIDLSRLNQVQRLRMIKSMRRSSTGLTEIGRRIRKEANLQRFEVKGYRSHKIEVDGIEIPIYDRPSVFNVEVGEESNIRDTEGMHQFIQ
jgi:proteasome lid subunit RPN8/RPN11